MSGTGKGVGDTVEVRNSTDPIDKVATHDGRALATMSAATFPTNELAVLFPA